MPINFPVVFHALESVMTFVIIGVIGYFLAKAGKAGREVKSFVSFFIINVALPPYLMYNIKTVLTRDQLLHLAYGLPAPYMSILFCVALSLILARVLAVPRRRRGIFYGTFSFSNTMFIGLPINLALFGPEALPYVLLYYFANTSLFWTMGNYMLASGSENGHTRLLSLATLRHIVSPPLLGLFSGVTLLLLDIELPRVLGETARYLGSSVTPLAILNIGITLHGLGLSNLRIDRHVAAAMAGRLLVSPLALIIVTMVFTLAPEMRQVFIIQASLPAMSVTPVLANYYKLDEDYATVVVSLTTIASIITIPLFMAVAVGLG